MLLGTCPTPSNHVCMLQVCTRSPAGHLRTYGHLPASVSAHLAPLIDAQQITLTAQLVQTAATDLTDLDSSEQEHAAAATAIPMDSIGLIADTPAAAGSRHASSSAAPGHNSSGTLTRMGSGTWVVKLTATQVSSAAGVAGSSVDAATALALAADAGRDSLEPGKNSGAVLASAFEHILQQTRQHDVHLLDQQEQQLLRAMQALPSTARSLLLRLLLRKRRWYSLAGLSYSEVPDVPTAAAQLRAAGLVCWSSDADADLDSLLPELPAVMLKAVLAKVLPRKHPAMVSSSSSGTATGGPEGKAALVSSIQSNACRARLHSALTGAAGDWLMVLPAVLDTFVRLQHIYFLNQGQDLGMFLAVDRGALRYPTYCVTRARAVFSSRQCLLEYEEALQLAAQVDQALEDDNTDLAWHLLQPALTALHGGSHKRIVWDEEHGAVMPNPPSQQQQQASTPPLQHQHHTQPQQAAHQQQRQAQVQHSQTAALLDIQSPRHRSPSSNSFTHHCSRISRSRSRSPSPSSNSPDGGSDSEGLADSATSCSNSYSSRGVSRSSTLSSSGARRLSRRTPAPPSVIRTRAAAAAEAMAGNTAEQPDLAAQLEVPSVKGQVYKADEFGAAAAAQAPTASTAAAAPPLFLARFCACWVHCSLGTVAVSLLEKQKRWSDAVDLLRVLLGGNACVGRRGEWWERLAINLEHQGLPEQALEAAESALADSWVRGGDLLGLQRRCLRLGKPPRRWRRPSWSAQAEWEPRERAVTGRPLNCNTGSKSRFYGLDGSQVTVEELALQHYASEAGGAWQGLHSEGGVWATLFGLLLWDVLFMGVPDVFRSPFQVAPLDLDSDAFYPARMEQLDRQLTRIADGEAGDILSSTWAAHQGTMCRGVNWQRFSQDQLLDICQCVGGLGLAAVLRLMAEDHAGATGGLPDLLLWRTSDLTAKVVEVKGPRDRLSNQQRFWLAHMANSNIQVEVCKIREPSSTSRK
eukprot:GHUV01015850.1.p1 GENE.GHUV01015850.1~~GHUV01015850.1.p1  ORF type:complete len:977 (+),score=369.04 GHUV01015850.1:95-3025(+)